METGPTDLLTLISTINISLTILFSLLTHKEIHICPLRKRVGGGKGKILAKYYKNSLWTFHSLISIYDSCMVSIQKS